MSTLAIQEALARLNALGEPVGLALAELEAIEKAAKALSLAHSGKPLAYSECDDADNAVELLRVIAREAK